MAVAITQQRECTECHGTAHLHMVIRCILCVFYHKVNRKKRFRIGGTCRHFLPVTPLGPQVPETLTRTGNQLAKSSDKSTAISSWAHSALSFHQLCGLGQVAYPL